MRDIVGRRLGGIVAGSLLVLSLACAPDRPTTPDGQGGLQQAGADGGAVVECLGTGKPSNAPEGEVFGNFYVNGLRSCSNYQVEFLPYAEARSRLHMLTYRPGLLAQPIWVQAFEWWDPRADGPCSVTDLNDYLTNGAPQPETDHDGQGDHEGHCVRPGRYSFDAGGRVFDVDYIQPSGVRVHNLATGIDESVEVTAYDANLATWQDLVINTDLTTVQWSDTPILEIQNALSNAYAGTFADTADPAGTKDDWFRFSVARSTTTWNINSNGSALARLYFDGNDLSRATGYYDYRPEGVPVMRLYRFPNPTTEYRVYQVGLELLRPDETPANHPSTSRPVTITRVKPDLAPGSVTFSPGVVQPAGSFTATIQERNLLGTAEVEGGRAAGIYLSTNQVMDPMDVQVGGFVESQPIGPSGSLTLPRPASVPPGVAAGLYYVLVRLDTTNAVLENDEGNNAGASTTRIRILGPPPMTVSINYGPSTVRPNVNCEWAAQVSGGTAPYSWVWRVNGKVVPGVDNDIYYINHGSSFTLSIDVADSQGQNVSDSRPITVTSSAPYCPL